MLPLLRSLRLREEEREGMLAFEELRLGLIRDLEEGILMVAVAVPAEAEEGREVKQMKSSLPPPSIVLFILCILISSH